MPQFLRLFRCLALAGFSICFTLAAQAQSAIAPTDRPELALQLGHSLSVHSLAYSPDGSTLASGGGDGTVKIWDARARELIRTIPAHTAGLRAVAWSPDGSTLASASDDGSVKFWNSESGRLQRTIAARPAVENPVPRSRALTLAYSPDGNTLAVGYGDYLGAESQGELVLYDARSGQLRRILSRVIGMVLTVAFSPDGSTLASGGHDKTLRFWNAQTGAALPVSKTHSGAISSLAYSPDGSTLALGGMDNSVVTVSAASGATLRSFNGHTRPVMAVAFSPDGTSLATSGADQQVILWDARNGERLPAVAGANSISRAVAFSPDGSTLAVGSSNAIGLWDARTGAPLGDFEARPRWGSALAYSPDGKNLAATGGGDRQVYIWDTQTGRLSRTLEGANVTLYSVVYSPDGKWIAGAGTTSPASPGRTINSDYEIFIWNAATGTLARRLHGHKDGVLALAFSPDSKILASGSSSDQTSNKLSEIKFWNPQTGQLQRTLSGGQGQVNSLAFSSDGKMLASSIIDRRGKHAIEIWNPQTGQLARTISSNDSFISSLAFRPGESTLAAGGHAGSIRLWNAGTGEFLKSLPHGGGFVRSVAYSPDGSTLASGGRDNNIRVWNAEDGRLLNVLRGHESSIEALSFSPRGNTVASGSTDTTMRLWNAREGRQLVSLLTAPPEKEERLSSIEPLWLAATPEGYYDCAEGADYLIKWRFNQKLLPFYHFEETYRRPDLLQRALRGERIAARPLLITRVPPAIRLLALANIPDQPGKLRILAEAADDAELQNSNFQFYVNGVLIPDQVAKPIVVDGKPIIVDGKPVEVNARPIIVDGKPIVVDGKPIVVDGKPIVVDGKPITADGRNVPAAREISVNNGATPSVMASGGDSMASYAFHRLYVMDIALPAEEKIVLRAVVTDNEGNKSDDGLTMQRQQIEPKKGNLYVLAVGVSSYRNPLYNISYAADDARFIASTLDRQQGQQYAKVQTTVLNDRQASVGNIRAALSTLKAAGPDDTVMVFLSGHGIAAGDKTYFAPWGVFVRDLPGTCLEWSEIVGSISNLYAKKLLFTDACHSGAKLGDWQATSSQLAEAVRRKSGIVMFASSQGDEFSFEDKEVKQGTFSRALAEGFAGKADIDNDGNITLPELAMYVPKRVSESTKGLQNPQLVLVQDFNPQTVLAKTN